jgi:hypothetical protein
VPDADVTAALNVTAEPYMAVEGALIVMVVATVVGVAAVTVKVPLTVVTE